MRLAAGEGRGAQEPRSRGAGAQRGPTRSGPRPERPQFVAQLEQQLPYYAERHMVKPGITGWAQINGWRGETDTSEKIQRRVEHGRSVDGPPPGVQRAPWGGVKDAQIPRMGGAQHLVRWSQTG